MSHGLRLPLPTIAALSLGFVACNDVPAFLGSDAATNIDTGGGGTTDVGGVGRDTGGPTDTGGLDAGAADTGGRDAAGSDAGATDAGGFDMGGADSGSSDSGTTDAGGFDSGSDSGPSDSGGPTDPPLSDAQVAELCAGFAQCSPDPESYAQECEEYANEYFGELVAEDGRPCFDAYVTYWECLLENGDCLADEDGYEYLDAGDACDAEYAAFESVCDFDADPEP